MIIRCWTTLQILFSLSLKSFFSLPLSANPKESRGRHDTRMWCINRSMVRHANLFSRCSFNTIICVHVLHAWVYVYAFIEKMKERKENKDNYTWPIRLMTPNSHHSYYRIECPSVFFLLSFHLNSIICTIRICSHTHKNLIWSFLVASWQ